MNGSSVVEAVGRRGSQSPSDDRRWAIRESRGQRPPMPGVSSRSSLVPALSQLVCGASGKEMLQAGGFRRGRPRYCSARDCRWPMRTGRFGDAHGPCGLQPRLNARWQRFAGVGRENRVVAKPDHSQEAAARPNAHTGRSSGSGCVGRSRRVLASLRPATVPAGCPGTRRTSRTRTPAAPGHGAARARFRRSRHARPWSRSCRIRPRRSGRRRTG